MKRRVWLSGAFNPETREPADYPILEKIGDTIWFLDLRVASDKKPALGGAEILALSNREHPSDPLEMYDTLEIPPSVWTKFCMQRLIRGF